ncbi:MAG: serine hydrolase domain-containing protein [Actinomycetota bacterium]
MSDEAITRLADDLTEATTPDFSGVVLVHDGERPVLELASGLAQRADGRAMTIDTRLATASGTKGFTALAAASLIADGVLAFDTPVRSVVGDDLPDIDHRVTIEHLLAHRSGIGDYLDEDELDDIDAYVLDLPVHQLTGPEDYLPILRGHRQREEPGSRFRYNNGGYVVLALVIERAAGRSYHDEVRRRVFEPAGLAATDFLRSDALPADTAVGYLGDGRTNVFHLPVVGTGDGGAYTTGPDLLRFWAALFAGRIVDRALVEQMTSVVSDEPPERYGLGFWIGPDRATVQLEGMDAGVSLRTGANPRTGLRYALIANNSSDVWSLAKIVDRHLAD